MKRRISREWLAIAGVVVACSSPESRLGGTAQGPRTGNGSGGSQFALGAGGGPGEIQVVTNYPVGFGDPTAPHDAAAGEWTGYIENYVVSRSDGVTVEFDSLSDTSVSGRIIFGDANAPVPDFSDPHPYISNGKNTGGAHNDEFPAESYPFTLLDGSLTGTRVQFTVNNDEIWQQWCGQQTPIPDELNPGLYRCVPNKGFAYDDQQRCYIAGGPQIDCAQVALCAYNETCACDAQSCSVTEQGPHFDMSMQEDRMDGSIAALGVGDVNVHLMKQ
jgi:hypothetical protein